MLPNFEQNAEIFVSCEKCINLKKIYNSRDLLFLINKYKIINTKNVTMDICHDKINIIKMQRKEPNKDNHLL